MAEIASALNCAAADLRTANGSRKWRVLASSRASLGGRHAGLTATCTSASAAREAGGRAAAEAAGAPPAGLTPREREIVALIARGYSNKAIAAELYISPATAARHVANILAKLGFSSRSQIAAWAVQGHDLA